MSMSHGTTSRYNNPASRIWPGSNSNHCAILHVTLNDRSFTLKYPINGPQFYLIRGARSLKHEGPIIYRLSSPGNSLHESPFTCGTASSLLPVPNPIPRKSLALTIYCSYKLLLLQITVNHRSECTVHSMKTNQSTCILWVVTRKVNFI